MKTLYFECFSGISGDMTIGALLDLGASKEKLIEALKSLNVYGFEIDIYSTQKCGITATKFDVIIENTPHDHGHHNHEGEHHHRGMNEIKEIINSAKITERAKKMALDMFDIIAEAEGKVHNLPKNEVHFHEVGAIDSIVDVIAIAVCIDDINADRYVFSTLYEGQGHVYCQHGKVPVPAPATLEISVKYGIELKITKTQGELITPTGAAFVASMNPEFLTMPDGKIKAVGMGAGTKDFDHANILRVYMIEENTDFQDKNSDKILLIETNIDDASGESLGYAMDILFENGALDVYYTPIFMKKNRPAYTLSVICEKSIESNIITQIFKHTTSIGIRKKEIDRVKMEKSFETVATALGDVVLKHCIYNDIKKIYMEYESIKKIAQTNNLALNEVENIVSLLKK